jgi:hypothetical protein
MKTFIFFAIAMLALSCLKEGGNSYYIRTTGRVEITQVNIPDTTTNNQFADIDAIAEAPNGCWNNINVILTKINDYKYSIEAFGVFESIGYCEAVKVYEDTTIAFKPTQTGTYKFEVTKNQNETVIDSMVVVGGI